MPLVSVTIHIYRWYFLVLLLEVPEASDLEWLRDVAATFSEAVLEWI